MKRVLLPIFVCWALMAGADSLTEVTMVREDFEASGLLLVRNQGLLAAKAWDLAFWTVGDEKRVEDNIALIGHTASSPLGKGWELAEVEAYCTACPKTDDAEAICRKDGWVYIIGSHFGKKAGPLKAKRQFAARFRERDVAAADKPALQLDASVNEFRFHRAINDALAHMEEDLIELTGVERVKFIADTLREGLKDGDTWTARIKDSDWPINIEGATFLDSGSLLLGLRYPVTKEGHPILIEVADFETLLRGGTPAIAKTSVLANVGGKKELTGIRALRFEGGSIHAITGTIDSRLAESLVLQQHPEGGKAGPAHYKFKLPDTRKPITAELVRRFPGAQDIEGIAFDPDGRAFYIKDEPGKAPILFEE